MTELSFKGKEFVYNHHLSVPFRPLVPDAAKGIGPVDLNGNLIIQGDNLHALKALLPMYAGRVDCIFIDPPYNTGNEGWAYNDNVSAPMIKEWLAANPIGIEDGLRHDKWCAMMWPRLRLLHELLADDGILFISIDDNENSRLLQLVSEIYGPENVIGQFIWRSRQNKDNRNKSGLSNDHEYVIIVGKSIAGEARLGESYSNQDNDTRGAWSSGNMVGMASKEGRPNLHYDLYNPATGINYGCPERGWRYSQETMRRLNSDNRIIWPPTREGRPREKVFLEELGTHTNVSSVIDGGFYTRDGTDAYERVMGSRDFDFPKPPALVQFLIEQHPKPDALILDSFAGSGTTAHAVLEANKRDGGNRKFILVEMEDYADRLTAERVRRVIGGYDFTGTQRTELMRESLNWSKLQKADRLTEQVDKIENLHGHEYDRITKQVKDGELIVTGERSVKDRTEGLGGTFTYCTLGAAIDLDAILQGTDLPAWDALGRALFHMATNTPLDPAMLDEGAGYLGQADGQHLWLIYRPDLNWLKSPEAALTLSYARRVAAAKAGKHLVFAPARHVSQKMLNDENVPVEFVPLPFALYRIERG